MGPLITHRQQEDSLGLAGLNALLNIRWYSQAPPPAGSPASSPHPRQLRSPRRLLDWTGKPSADCCVPLTAKNRRLLYNNFSFKLTIPGNLLPCVLTSIPTKAELLLACSYDLLSKVNVESFTRREQNKYQVHLEWMWVGINGRGMSVEASELIPTFSMLLCIEQTAVYFKEAKTGRCQLSWFRTAHQSEMFLLPQCINGYLKKQMSLHSLSCAMLASLHHLIIEKEMLNF